MLFVHLKGQMEINNAKLRVALLNSKCICVDCARMNVSSLKLDKALLDTYSFFSSTYGEISMVRAGIINKQNAIEHNLSSMKASVSRIEDSINDLQQLENKYKDIDF